ncbi:MAG: hypothetical protein ABIN18_05580 [Pseudomonadota bacterium]
MNLENPISEVYDAMAAIGYETGEDFHGWEKRIQLFHVTRTGGIAFVSDTGDPSIWWLNAYCPNHRPTNNTVRFLIDLAFASGCQVIRSEVKRAGSAKMLERLGFRKVNEDLYERRT